MHSTKCQIIKEDAFLMTFCGNRYASILHIFSLLNGPFKVCTILEKISLTNLEWFHGNCNYGCLLLLLNCESSHACLARAGNLKIMLNCEEKITFYYNSARLLYQEVLNEVSLAWISLQLLASFKITFALYC